MVKKLSGDGGTVIALFGLAFLYVLAVIVTAAVYVFPVVLVITAVMAEARARKQDGQNPALSDPERQFLLETEGQPETLSSLEDAEATDEIDYVEEIIDDPETPWEECDENDKKYVNKWLDIWGITSARNFQGGLDRG